MRVAVAVSGGVDSLAALLLTKRAGHEPLALHGLFFERDDANIAGLEALCRGLGIPLHVADLRDVFRQKVIEPFVAAHAAGQTPNPCCHCNAAIKFGALLDTALALGCEAMASGHYAAAGPCGPCAAANAAKDQSYFLSLVPGERLALARFPLSGMASKNDTRRLVSHAGLAPPAADESQDVCFLARMGRLEFLGAAGLEPDPGPVWLKEDDGSERLIGRHEGLWRYTIGQRKGLGIAWREPLHVLKRRQGDNALLLGPARMLGMSRILTAPANYFAPPGMWPDTVLLRCRHRGPLLRARAAPMADGSLEIRLDEAAFPSAPGQIAALYAGDERVLAGAVIRDVV